MYIADGGIERGDGVLSVLGGANPLKTLRKFGRGPLFILFVADRSKKPNDFKRLRRLENQVV